MVQGGLFWGTGPTGQQDTGTGWVWGLCLFWSCSRAGTSELVGRWRKSCQAARNTEERDLRSCNLLPKTKVEPTSINKIYPLN